MVLGFKEQFIVKIFNGTKIHTIREDKHNRWKAGNKIHFATGVRTKQYKEFMRGKCISVQEFKIVPPKDNNSLRTYLIDGKELQPISDIVKLSKNDGFDKASEFVNWFGDNFTGKIIHWTYFKY